MIEQTQRVKKGLMQDLFTEGYFEHEETKNTPIGEVPESWRLKNISEIGKIINGSTFPEEEQGKSEGVPFIKVSDTNKTDKYASYAENFITRERADELNVRILPENSVILPKRGAAILTNKRRLLSQDSAIDNNQIGVYTEDISNDYLFHYLCTVDMERYAQKGAVHSLNKSTLAKIKIPVPEQDEQKKIAKSLNSLDAEIYQLKEERDRLQRFKKGLMQDLLTGEVRTSESVEVLDEVREVES
jgi:type I restriction enzyme S subunit